SNSDKIAFLISPRCKRGLLGDAIVVFQVNRRAYDTRIGPYLICIEPKSNLFLFNPYIGGYLKHFFMTFGERIVQLRKGLKWSQEELAKQIGTSAPIVGRYERNEIKPSIEVAVKIADALGVSIDYLLGKSDKAVVNKKLMKRIEEIEAFSEEQKEKIYYFLDMAIRDAKAKQAYGS